MPEHAEKPRPIVDTRWRLLLVVLTLACSWLGMQWVHEAGHVLAALATGGVVERVALHPLSISRTDVSVNPRPLLVAWAGPLFGFLAPLVAWQVARAIRARSAYLVRFFAGFCGVANGAYLGLGSFQRVGDCGDLLNHGAAIWHLWLFGAGSAAAGVMLWNGLGPNFGFGPRAVGISAPHCLVLAALLSALAAAGAWLG
jgi:hypothetical protein